MAAETLLRVMNGVRRAGSPATPLAYQNGAGFAADFFYEICRKRSFGAAVEPLTLSTTLTELTTRVYCC